MDGCAFLFLQLAQIVEAYLACLLSSETYKNMAFKETCLKVFHWEHKKDLTLKMHYSDLIFLVLHPTPTHDSLVLPRKGKIITTLSAPSL